MSATITYWTGNSEILPGIVTLTVTAVANGGTLTAIFNQKPITYTCTASDTTTTAAANWAALLSAQAAPPEFQEEQWSQSAAVITVTGLADGTPFFGMIGGLTSSGAGGSTVTQATVQSPLSQSDVGLAANWLRGGVQAIPTNGDPVIVSNSTIPLLWNLTALAAVQFRTFERWQSFTGTIGLPVQNPNGYLEYRPQYFQFTGYGPGGNLLVLLGLGTTGTGPTREKYNVGTFETNLTAVASGTPQDDYSILFLATNTANVINVSGTSVGMAVYPAELSGCDNAQVNQGGLLVLGEGFTFTGTLVINAASAIISCAPATAVIVQNGGSLTVQSEALTYPQITAQNGSNITWNSNSAITALNLTANSILDKSGDPRDMVITAGGGSSIDGTCIINDPATAIAWSNPITVTGQVTSGPFPFAGPRTVQIS